MPESRSEVIITPEGVASFLNIFRPHPTQKTADGRPKYTMTIIFKKKEQKTPMFKRLKEAAEEVVAEKWSDRPKKLKWPFLTAEDLENVPNGLEDDDVFLRLTAINKPGVVDQHVQPILDESLMYAGAVVRCSVQAFTWTDDKGGKGVSFGLNNVQKIKDGPHLAGGSRAEDDFEEVDDDDNLLD
jgi:hypothetical protein